MSNATTAPAMRLRHGPSRPLLARFDQPHASSDGGAMLLNGCDTRHGLSEALAAAIDDRRDPRRVTHSVLDLAPIASQPTLSRFENALDGRSLVRMGRALAEVGLAALGGERGMARDSLVYAGAVVLFGAGAADTIEAGAERVRAVLDDGSARARLFARPSR